MENQNQEPAYILPFVPEDYGLDPADPSDRADVLDYAHGDELLLGYTLAALQAREDYDESRLDTAHYYSKIDHINQSYNQRLELLGIAVNPKP